MRNSSESCTCSKLPLLPSSSKPPPHVLLNGAAVEQRPVKNIDLGVQEAEGDADLGSFFMPILSFDKQKTAVQCAVDGGRPHQAGRHGGGGGVRGGDVFRDDQGACLATTKRIWRQTRCERQAEVGKQHRQQRSNTLVREAARSVVRAFLHVFVGRLSVVACFFTLCVARRLLRVVYTYSPVRLPLFFPPPGQESF